MTGDIARVVTPTETFRRCGPAVGLGTLRRLRVLDQLAGPLLSVYLPLDAAGVAEGEAQLAALTSGFLPCSSERCLMRVRDFMRSMPAFPAGTRGVALFSHGDGSQLEVVPLPERIEAMTVLDGEPWLEPLTDMCSRGNFGVAVAGPSSVRLLRGSAGHLVEFAVVRVAETTEPPLPGALADRLERAHRRRALDTLIVAAPREHWPSLAGALPYALRTGTTTFVDLDLSEMPAREVAGALVPLLERDTPPGCDAARWNGRMRLRRGS